MNIADYTGGRNNNFTSIRLSAALAVLISHSFVLATGSNDHEPLISLSLGITLGELAVDVFFVTSGFLVFASLKRSENIFDFSIARILRIFPGLLAMLVIVTFFLGPLASSLSLSAYLSSATAWQYFAINAALLPAVFFPGHDWLPGLFTGNPFANTVNGSLWTLPIEFSLYIILAVIWGANRLTMSRLPRVSESVVIVAAIILFSLSIFINFVTAKWYLKIVEMSYLFFVGAALFALRNYIFLSKSIAAFAIFITVLAAATSRHYFFIAHLVLMPYILIFLALVPGGRIRSLNRLGDYSYGIYIYAFPIQQLLVQCFPRISITQLIFFSGLSTLLLAFASWHLIESRALKMKMRLRQPKSISTAIA